MSLAYADEDCGHISIREHVIILYFYYILRFAHLCMYVMVILGCQDDIRILR